MIRPACLCAVLFAAGCHRPVELPKYDHVPAFIMTDSEGRAFKSSKLRGKVWVADFIYTNCPAECPLMTSKMHKLSRQISPEVRLISISVDPDRDTPAALRQFASHYDAPTPQWTFLTGDTATVHQLAWSTFHIGDVIGKMQHSTKFILVDQADFIRGYYSTFDEDGMRALVRDAGNLLND